MILMINGAFGVGKTATAERLAALLPNSMIFDPEEVGFLVRRLTEGFCSEREDTGDFQDIALWRALTIDTAGRLRQQYGRTLIIPMTLAHLSYFREIREGLARIDPVLHHFCLTASFETIHGRLKRRGDAEDAWPFHQTARCVEAFQSPEFEMRIDTEHRNLQEVVAMVLSRIQVD